MVRSGIAALSCYITDMGIKLQKYKLTVAAFVVILMQGVPVAAQSVTSELVEQLKTAELSEVAGIERALKLEWSKSGSTALDLLLRRGLAAMAEGQLALAIEHLTALTDQAPDFAEGWHARARAYFAADLIGPAMGDLQRSLALNPDNYDTVFGLGSVMMTIGDEILAEKAFREVLRLHPHHENATNALKRLEGQDIGQSL